MLNGIIKLDDRFGRRIERTQCLELNYSGIFGTVNRRGVFGLFLNDRKHTTCQ